MFDLHCHILPSLDDGAGSMEEALKMLEKAAFGGTRGIVATPHSREKGNRKLFLPALSRLREAARERQIPTRIYAGEELLLNEDGLLCLFSGDVLPINGSRYLLCEFEFSEDWEFAWHALDEVRKAGFIPIVAHPERYDFFRENNDAAREIHALGGLLQVNRGSIFGRHGSEVEEIAWYLLSSGQADFVASDGHSPYLRTPELSDAHERVSMAFSYDYADKLMLVNPGRVLRNEKISG